MKLIKRFREGHSNLDSAIVFWGNEPTYLSLHVTIPRIGRLRLRWRKACCPVVRECGAARWISAWRRF